MKPRYSRLSLIVILAAVVVAMLARAPRREQKTAESPAPAPLEAVALAWEGGRLVPSIISVPRGHRLRVTVENRGGSAVDFSLSGYGERVHIEQLAPGATDTLEFLAEFPGEDFAWMIDGRPAGRLAVTGSHLVEGHR